MVAILLKFSRDHSKMREKTCQFLHYSNIDERSCLDYFAQFLLYFVKEQWDSDGYLFHYWVQYLIC